MAVMLGRIARLLGSKQETGLGWLFQSRFICDNIFKLAVIVWARIKSIFLRGCPDHSRFEAGAVLIISYS